MLLTIADVNSFSKPIVFGLEQSNFAKHFSYLIFKGDDLIGQLFSIFLMILHLFLCRRFDGMQLTLHRGEVSLDDCPLVFGLGFLQF
jgi:hypothetical protein